MGKTTARLCAEEFNIRALEEIREAALSRADIVRRYDPDDRESGDKFIALAVAITNVIAMAEPDTVKTLGELLGPDLRVRRGEAPASPPAPAWRVTAPRIVRPLCAEHGGDIHTCTRGCASTATCAARAAQWRAEGDADTTVTP